MENEEEYDSKDIMEWIYYKIKADWFHLTALLILLIIMLWLGWHIDDVQNDCNEYWLEYLEDCECTCTKIANLEWDSPIIDLPVDNNISYGKDQTG